MPFVPFENCVAVTIEGRVDGQKTINDLAFRSTTGPRGAVDMDALLAALKVWYTEEMAPELNEAWTGVRMTIRGLTNEVGLVRETTLSGVQGGTTGEAAPNNCTMAVSFRTGVAGRSSRGRNYVPCLTNSQVVGNNIDTTWADTIVNVYSRLIFPASLDFLPGGWIWVVLSRKTNGDWRTTGQFLEVMTAGVSDYIVDSMRNRLPGRGS